MATKVTVDVEIKDNVKSLKAQFAEAKKELQAMAATYGENSKQAIEAAKRAAELKDIIDDSGEAIKNLQGGGAFKALSTSLTSVASGFSAVQGGLGLIGVEGEAVEKTLLKVQSAMALAEGLRGVEDAGRAFKALGATVGNAFKSMSNSSKVFLATGIGLIVTAIATAIAYSDELGQIWDKLTGQSSELRAQQEALNSTMADYNKGAQEAISKVNKVGVSFDLAKKGVISKDEALKTYNDTLGDSLGKANSYNEAEKLFRDKTDAYIKATALRAQANALLQKAAEEQANALTASMENQVDALDIVTKINPFASQEEQVKQAIKAQKEGVKQAQDSANKRAKIFDDEAQKLLAKAVEIENANKIEIKSESNKIDALKQTVDERKRQLEELRKFEQGIKDSRLSDEEQEILNIQRKYDEQFAIAKKYGQDLTLLEEGLGAEVNAIREKYRKQNIELLDAELPTLKELKGEQVKIEQDGTNAMQGILTDYYTEKNKKREEDEAKERLQNQARVDITLQGLQLVSDIATLFAKKDEASAKRAFQIQKAVSIAETTIKTIQGVQNAFTTASASPITIGFPAYPFIQAGVAGAFGVAQIAKIASTQYQGSSGSSAGSVSTPSGGQSSTPQFNIVGQANTNPLQQFDGMLKAYVVGSDVTTQQQLDRERINNALFG